MSRPPSRRRPVTAEEAKLWRSAMRDVAPLSGRRRPAGPERPEANTPIDRDLPLPLGPQAVPPPVAAPPVVPRGPAGQNRLPASGGTGGLDRRTDTRLRRGRLQIDGRIDLHGMTQAEAHAALQGFLRRSHHEGRRCILVITGKGSGAQGGGVLRNAVPRWIKEKPVHDMVVAFYPAQPKDGGEGALYVLLRRRRDRS